MGIGKLIGEVVGAVAAEKAVEAVNPDAGFLAKTVAAVAGFEGVKKVSEKLQENSDEKADASEDTATDSNS